MNVIAYCTEEVERQGHNIGTIDGIERVSWMLDAWSYALYEKDFNKIPNINDLLVVGQKIEPEKNGGFRTVDVWVGGIKCPDPKTIIKSLEELFEVASNTTSFGFYRRILEIHPFVDGNGRTGKVMLNWHGGMLLNPIFPRNDFWGSPIRNP